MEKLLFALTFFLSTAYIANAASIEGKVRSNNSPVEMVTVKLKGKGKGAITDVDGTFKIHDVDTGNYVLLISHMDYAYFESEIVIKDPQEVYTIEIELIDNPLLIDQVVVTATRTDKRQTDAPVIVGVINSKTLENVQACSLSEGLKFQPGLRVENNCQTCSYTQLRMNGLAGGYSQILINGRPIFSPLTGLYGLEQIPTNMIKRIEVVRGGGSALFGSSAIGGTVNVITKLPKKNSFSIDNNLQVIGKGTIDNVLSGNITFVTDSKKSGISFFVNNRNRQMYNHNGDHFSELPELKNLSFGTTLFLRPTENQKLEVSFSRLHEYRYGGEMIDAPAHHAMQAEERTHNVYIGSIDYQLNFNENNSSLIVYSAGQITDRSHFTGIMPDAFHDQVSYKLNAPYGTATAATFQAGTQFNHKLKKLIYGDNIITMGMEYVFDDVFDEIPVYNYTIDQTTKNFGLFLQSDWEIAKNLNLLVGARADKHNFLSNMVVSPRTSLMYTLKDAIQFRLGWAKGFRAPQAFDSDMHIAFAGGGISRITLVDNLFEERSNSTSFSINYDISRKKFVAGFTLEGFYTVLDGAFYYHPLGEDEIGELFEKRNGDGAIIAGGSIELRANWNRKVELESGFTAQSSKFKNPVEYSDILERTDIFLRTPNEYGYATLFLNPSGKFNGSLNAVYTGPMTMVHFGGAPEQLQDEYVTTQSFTELNAKIAYTFSFKNDHCKLQAFGGAKNIINAYQSDFDTGKNRDSNYIYGPATPRTVFIGLKWFSK